MLLVGGLETLQASSVEAGGIFLLVSRSGLAGGSPQQQSLARMGEAFYSIAQTLGFLPWVAVLAQGESLEHQWGKRLLNSFSLPPRGWLPLRKSPHW